MCVFKKLIDIKKKINSWLIYKLYRLLFINKFNSLLYALIYELNKKKKKPIRFKDTEMYSVNECNNSHDIRILHNLYYYSLKRGTLILIIIAVVFTLLFKNKNYDSFLYIYFFHNQLFSYHIKYNIADTIIFISKE